MSNILTIEWKLSLLLGNRDKIWYSCCWLRSRLSWERDLLKKACRGLICNHQSISYDLRLCREIVVCSCWAWLGIRSLLAQSSDTFPLYESANWLTGESWVDLNTWHKAWEWFACGFVRLYRWCDLLELVEVLEFPKLISCRIWWKNLRVIEYSLVLAWLMHYSILRDDWLGASKELPCFCYKL